MNEIDSHYMLLILLWEKFYDQFVQFSMEKKRGSVIYSTHRKNEANKMFIIWLLPDSGTGNKCRTRDLTNI